MRGAGTCQLYPTKEVGGEKGFGEGFVQKF